jgi:ABC-type multidrug transport system fused ATPase/permease subunit
VGVVGRTGAGKSSLIIALYRFVEATAGQILIDQRDIAQIPLSELRSILAIVPQEPTLFQGTLRSNLDPFQEYQDEEILQALQRVQLYDSLLVSYLNNSFTMNPLQDMVHSTTSTDTKTIASLLEKILVAEKGSNFSVGQRQLLCMARAILR